MPKVVIVGAGGHAKVVAEMLRASGHEIIGCTDAHKKGVTVNGIDVLGQDAEVLPKLLSQGIRHAFIALGDNGLRRRVAAEVAGMGFEFVNALGRTAVISPSARLGVGCAIMEGAILNAESVVGDFAIVNSNASVDHDCEVGAYAHIAPGCTLGGNVQIGEASFLGLGTRVVPGIAIASNVIIGAGGVVTRDVGSAGTWVGVPVKKIK